MTLRKDILRTWRPVASTDATGLEKEQLVED